MKGCLTAPAALVTVAGWAWRWEQRLAVVEALTSCQREPAAPSAHRQCRALPARDRWQAPRDFAVPRRDQITSVRVGVPDLKMTQPAQERLAGLTRSASLRTAKPRQPGRQCKK